MMNYIATQLVAFFTIVWEVPKGSGKIGIINQKTNVGWLPELVRIRSICCAIVVAVLVTVLMHIYLTVQQAWLDRAFSIGVVGCFVVGGISRYDDCQRTGAPWMARPNPFTMIFTTSDHFSECVERVRFPRHLELSWFGYSDPEVVLFLS